MRNLLDCHKCQFTCNVDTIICKDYAYHKKLKFIYYFSITFLFLGTLAKIGGLKGT